MLITLKSHFTIWRRSFYLACILYGVSWLFGIMATVKFAPQSVLHNLQIAPVMTYSAWYYISHNVGVEVLLLLGACTFGVGTGLVLCLNGVFDGIIVTAIARHYGLGVLLAGLLPHGLFEASAWILISTCGFLLSGRFKRIISSLWNNSNRDTSENAANRSLETPAKTKSARSSNKISEVYFALIITSTLLLMLAGTIEAYVSPMLLRILVSSAK
jgi:uncharacterized membrane protein SpoIIM required for sporulation